MPGTPLRSMALEMPAMVSMSFARASSSPAEAGVMMPSPLKSVPAKILVKSAVSSTETDSFSCPRFFRIWRADERSLAPSGSSSLKAENSSTSRPSRRRSASLMTRVSHWAVLITSSTRILPSASTSMYLRVFSSNSRPCVGQLRTVHILRSSSPR